MTALCATARGRRPGPLPVACTTRFLPLMLANFRGGPNPVPAKAALALMGILESDAVRQPLLPLDDAARERLAATLRELGLLDMRGGRSGTGAPEPMLVPVLAERALGGAA